jgi:hypothetical protein
LANIGASQRSSNGSASGNGATVPRIGTSLIGAACVIVSPNSSAAVAAIGQPLFANRD